MRSPLSLIQNDESGYVLVLALAIVGLISATSLLVSDNVNALLSMGQSARLENAADTIRKRILNGVYNNEAWRTQTAAADQCQRDGTTCAVGQAPQAFDLLDASGDLINEATSATAGFNLRGETCDTFNNDGNDACPLRFDLTWEPVNCNAGTCNIEVVGELRYRPSSSGSQSRLNPANYRIRVVRGREDGSLQNACRSMGGVFDQAENVCNLVSWSQACPAGQYLVQASSQGDPACRPSLGYGPHCPPGSGAVGVLSDGSLDCRSTLDWR